MAGEIIALVTAILTLTGPHITQGVSQLCSAKPSFTSPFVTPYWDEIVPVLGCSSRALAHRSQEVHVIYLKNDEDPAASSAAARHRVPVVNVHLSPRTHHGVHAGRLILILHAQRTVSWRLIGERISNESHHTIVVTRGSQIMENKNLPIMVMRRRETAITRVISWVIKRYKAVTAFAEMSQANKIIVKVGIADNSPRECNIDGRMPSPNVDASLEIAVSTELQRGCVVMETNRPSDKPDVHVINVRHVPTPEDEDDDGPWTSTGSSVQEETSGRHRRPKVRVVVEVRSKTGTKDKNILLILKAPLNVVWIVRSDDFGGMLKIVAEDPIERPHIPSTQVVHVKTEVLPESADELIFYADNKYGPLVSYFEVEKANKLLLFVDGYDSDVPSPVNVTPPEPKLPRQILWPPVTTATTAYFPSIAAASPPSALPSFIPSSKDLIKAQLGSIRASKSTGVQVLMKSPRRLSPDGLIQMPNVMLMEAMQVECMNDYMRVSFSRFTLERLGIQGTDLTLNSPACRAAANDSHLVLSTYFKGCGTEMEPLPQRVVYKNAVNFHLNTSKKISSGTSTMTMFKESDLLVDDEDQNLENGSGIDQETWKRNREEDQQQQIRADDLDKPKTLEFRCEYSTTGSATQEKESHSGDQRSNVSSPRWQIYDLQLYRDPDYRDCMRTNEFPATVWENDSIYAESRIDAGPHLRVVTEECWLSESANESVTEGRTTLIRNTCPNLMNVNIQRPTPGQIQHLPDDSGPSPISGQWNRFNFQLKTDYQKHGGPVYLHCMLGVCSVNPQHSNGNVKQCVAIEDYCLSRNSRSYVDQHVGTHHEILTRGPIHVIPKPQIYKFQTAMLSCLAPFLSREKKPDMQSPNSFDRVNEKIMIQEPAQVILIGLSTEAVVGIAFASFIIGAALTAILWFIHLRTDPLRNGRARATAPHHSGYDLSAHSGSSTPSSQVPMTT